MSRVTDRVLGLLGLARRGGKLALGEQPVAAACQAGRAKLVLLAADAGGATARRGEKLARMGRVPLVGLPYPKQEVGHSVGRSSCALLAPTDLGLAVAVVKGLAQRDEGLLALAQQLEEKAGRRGPARSRRAGTEKPPAQPDVQP
ncbi:MAG TPA: ribosomal L7Ae/L30e/S12e/Gadd45 family protein [Candidatus Enterenecus merdae]|nr:ribosomal L7Ae/L30e/S12e/Gadd45 family protein [Candidatus Enterenecus merdae]